MILILKSSALIKFGPIQRINLTGWWYLWPDQKALCNSKFFLVSVNISKQSILPVKLLKSLYLFRMACKKMTQDILQYLSSMYKNFEDHEIFQNVEKLLFFTLLLLNFKQFHHPEVVDQQWCSIFGVITHKECWIWTQCYALNID